MAGTNPNNVHIQFGGFSVVERSRFITTFNHGGQVATGRLVGYRLNKAPNPPN